MILDTALLNTQPYKGRIKGKVDQSIEWTTTFPYTSAIEKKAFESPSNKVINFTYYESLVWCYIFVIPELYTQWLFLVWHR